jgi:hypothetical protein
MKWKETDHFLLQLRERAIARETVYTSLEFPDAIVVGPRGRLIYQRRFGDSLLRVVVEGDALITVYVTSKVRKYLEDQP